MNPVTVGGTGALLTTSAGRTVVTRTGVYGATFAGGFVTGDLAYRYDLPILIPGVVGPRTFTETIIGWTYPDGTPAPPVPLPLRIGDERNLKRDLFKELGPIGGPDTKTRPRPEPALAQ